MRKELLKKLLAGLMTVVLVLAAAGCTSQVSKDTDSKDAGEEASDCCEGKEKDDCCEESSESLCCKEDKSTGEIENKGTADTDNINTEFAALASLSQEELEKKFADEEGAKRKLHISYDGSLCPAPIPIAQLKGFFEAEGLDTEIVLVENQRDALASGKIDTALGMLTDWLPSIQNGVDLRFPLALHTGCTSAAVLKDSSITKFEKGQKVGVVGPIGGVFHNIALRFIAHDGFKTDDFQWVSLDAGTILKALQEGQVDVIVAPDQMILQWEDDGLVKEIRSQTFDDDFKDEACCAIGFPGEFVEENPVTVLKVTRAIYNAALWIQESEANRKEAAELLNDAGYVSGDPDFNARVLGNLRYGLDNNDLETSLSHIVDEFVDLEILNKDTDKEAFKKQILIKYDLDLLKE